MYYGYQHRVQISQYADDTTLLLDGSEVSLRLSLLLLKLYDSFSSLNVSVGKKPKLCGSIPGNCEDYNLCWEEVTGLGVKFTLDQKI